MSNTRRTDEMKKLFTLPLKKNEVAFMYLGYSGVIVRTAIHAIAIDPASLVRDEEITAMKGLDLILFTHSHGDHYNSEVATNLFTASDASVLAEPMVASDLEEKIPSNKLTSITPGKLYVFDGITVTTVKGIHRGPISLFQIKMGDLAIFHGGDSGYVPVTDYPSDLAFLPTGSPSPTASPEDAFKMATELRAKTVVAIHGSEGQSKELARTLKEKMPTTPVMIPEPYVSTTVTL